MCAPRRCGLQAVLRSPARPVGPLRGRRSWSGSVRWAANSRRSMPSAGRAVAAGCENWARLRQLERWRRRAPPELGCPLHGSWEQEPPRWRRRGALDHRSCAPAGRNHPRNRRRRSSRRSIPRWEVQAPRAGTRSAGSRTAPGVAGTGGVERRGSSGRHACPRTLAFGESMPTEPGGLHCGISERRSLTARGVDSGGS